MIETSRRMKNLKQGVFALLLDKKNELTNQDMDIIDFSVGTPNIPPTDRVMQVISDEVKKPENYIYAIQDSVELTTTVQDWYKVRYGVRLKPEEISTCYGSQEGLNSALLPFIDEGDCVILPDPAYPAFTSAANIVGADIYFLPQREENGYVMDVSEVSEEVANKAKIIIASYPNNPTTAVADDTFYISLIAFAKKYDIFVIHDNAYSELIFDGKVGKSFLAFKGAKDVGVEFNSLSKTYGLAGARIGFYVGNRDFVSILTNFRSNTNFGMFLPIQKAAIEAITQDQSCVKKTCRAYQDRRDVMIESFDKIGWKINKSKGSMFVWAKLPKGYTDSFDFAMKLVEKTGVLVVPGISFGKSGEGHVRFALVASKKRIKEAAKRIGRSGLLRG